LYLAFIFKKLNLELDLYYQKVIGTRISQGESNIDSGSKIRVSIEILLSSI
jgi:hypothetical protein